MKCSTCKGSGSLLLPRLGDSPAFSKSCYGCKGLGKVQPSYPLYPTPAEAGKIDQVRLDVIKDNLESIIRATRAITVMMNIIEAEAELKKS
jgi:hypothetical protein